MLTAFAESDFRSYAVQRETIGVFQQNLKYWPSATQGTEAQCRAFISDFQHNSKHHNGDPVHDAWITQRWELPGAEWPDTGPLFEREKHKPNTETENYFRRLSTVDRIISDRKLP